MNDEYYDAMMDWDDEWEDGMRRPSWAHPFAEPGARSALRATSQSNPRNLPCPTCGEPDRLTPADQALGYQCDACADRDEGVMW